MSAISELGPTKSVETNQDERKKTRIEEVKIQTLVDKCLTLAKKNSDFSEVDSYLKTFKWSVDFISGLKWQVFIQMLCENGQCKLADHISENNEQFFPEEEVKKMKEYELMKQNVEHFQNKAAQRANGSSLMYENILKD
jgi:hypothetical protein